jgi:hypothetical protein
VETQLREKPLRGSQTQEFHYSEDITRYKTVTLTCTDAVVVPWSLTCNPTRMLPNQVHIPEGVFNGTPYLRAESAISFFDARVSRPQLSDVRTVIFELQFLPYGDVRPDGIQHRSYGWLIFPFLELGKKSETDRVLVGVRTCCWNVRTDASWHRNFSIQYGVRTEWTLRPDGWC